MNRAATQFFIRVNISEEFKVKVKEIMTAPVKSCSPAAHLAAVAEIMRKSNCGTLPVVDGDGKVIGMITDRDICLAISQKDHDPSRSKVSEVISGKVYGCAPRDEVQNALKTMRTKKVKRLPVVNGTGVLKGILSIGDIFLRARKAKGKKSQKPSYKDLARTLQAICGPRAPKLAKSQPRKKAVTVAVK